MEGLEQCTKCKNQKHLTPNMKLYISICDHFYCEGCYNTLLPQKQSTFVCLAPNCRQTLTKENFTNEDGGESSGLVRECTIRKRVYLIYNMKRVDFDSLRAYNDYLEEVEDICQRMINQVDVDATAAQMRRYRLQNEALITRNNIKRQQDEDEYEKQEEKERQKVEEMETWEKENKTKLQEHLVKEKEAQIRAMETGSTYKPKKFRPLKKPEKLIKPSVSKPLATTPVAPLSAPLSNPTFSGVSYRPMPKSNLPAAQGPQLVKPLPLGKMPPPRSEVITKKEQNAAGWESQSIRQRAIEEAYDLFLT